MADAATATTTDTAAATTTADTKTDAGAAAAATTTEAKPTLIGADAAKTEGDKKTEGDTLIGKTEDKKEETKTEDKKTEAPVFQLDKLKLPEGMDPKDPILAKFGETMLNDKMSPQERSQALLDLHSDVIKAVGEANTKAWNDTKAEWEGEIKADKEIGGDKLQPTLQQISKALDATIGPEAAKAFKTGFNVTGAGSHPAVVRGMAKIAALLTEGGHIPGSPGKGKMDLASTFFPNSPDMKGN